MSCAVLALPGLLDSPDGEPFLPRSATLESIAAHGRVRRTAAPRTLGEWLGLEPEEADLAFGPLVVAALGAHPPERSISFAVEILGLEGDVLQPPPVLTQAEHAEIVTASRKLDTRRLTLVANERSPHGLVWEDWGEFDALAPDEAVGKPLAEALPRGDGERELRRYIEDSVNLLSELELNRRRAGEGFPVAGVLWPFAPGMRRPVPNLALRYGPISVTGGDIALRGLARLAGLSHTPAPAGKGLDLPWSDLRAAMGSGILVIQEFARLREQGLFEEGRWLANRLVENLLVPLLDELAKDVNRSVMVVASGRLGGLSLELHGRANPEAGPPFDERAFEDGLGAAPSVARCVSAALT
jgi:hypothetical protein